MATNSRWREYASKIIRDIISAYPNVTDKKQLRTLISSAYPFGEKKYHPYKIWCDEVSVQLGEKKSKNEKEDPNQLNLL